MPGPERLGEFALIARHLAPLSLGLPGAFNLTDDAALISPPPGFDLVLTTDAMIEGVHFLASDGPGNIARKALRVNLSDLAAKGAKPYCYQMVLGLPQAPDEAWMAAFAAGLAADQAEYGISLSGGDTVRQPERILVSITAIGLVPKGCMLRRNGAQAGDALYVSGSIGDAALALRARLHGQAFPATALAYFGTRLDLPSPRVNLGQRLQGRVHAALDVSDGLVQDAGHLAHGAGLAVRIDAARVPLSAPAAECVARQPDLLAGMLTGGDDYEILFAAPPALDAALPDLASSSGVAITRIGTFLPGSGVQVMAADGSRLDVSAGGFQHF
ncbi:thiamine-phosphate kinase [Ferrovibrio sp.]|uniref:thiamine-phosphate kinase n=1 Tax=Ferrovibrio sp. TaxID=1917215 RepID=UPI0035B30184